MAKAYIRNRWQSLLVSERHRGNTPSVPGIYAFISFNYFTKEKAVVYIGKSNDLQTRLKLSHKVEQVGPPDEDSILFVKIMITDDLHRKEIEYIKRFKPVYNVQHNPNIKRKITYENGKTLY